MVASQSRKHVDGVLNTAVHFVTKQLSICRFNHEIAFQNKFLHCFIICNLIQYLCDFGTSHNWGHHCATVVITCCPNKLLGLTDLFTICYTSKKLFQLFASTYVHLVPILRLLNLQVTTMYNVSVVVEHCRAFLQRLFFQNPLGYSKCCKFLQRWRCNLRPSDWPLKLNDVRRIRPRRFRPLG
jgi:hypothetical protein